VVGEGDEAIPEVCGHGVVAMDGVNVVKPSGYSVGKGIWEQRTGGGPEDLRTVMANARFASRDGAALQRGRGLGLRSARSAHAVGVSCPDLGCESLPGVRTARGEQC